MATGDENDFLSRIRALLPPWFPNPSTAPPFITGLIDAYANMAAWIYSLIQYVTLQTRIATATDGWLDLIAYDFLGPTLIRGAMTDAQFRAAIIAAIFQARNTRAAIAQVLQSLTGQAPLILVPNGGDPPGYYNGTGYYGSPTTVAFDNLQIDSAGHTLEIDTAGDQLAIAATYTWSGPTPLGSRGLPFQIFVTAYRGNGVTDAQIYAAVAATVSDGITGWVQIQNPA
jgi:hypothetical protein